MYEVQGDWSIMMVVVGGEITQMMIIYQELPTDNSWVDDLEFGTIFSETRENMQL